MPRNKVFVKGYFLVVIKAVIYAAIVELFEKDTLLSSSFYIPADSMLPDKNNGSPFDR
jgi:hypothetical protein